MKIILRYKKSIVSVILIITIITVAILVKHKKENSVVINSSKDNIMLSKGDIFTVKTGSVANVIAFTGDLSPLNQTAISSEISAIVSKVMVYAGQFVQKGQVLAVLDNTELKEAVSEQEAQLDSAKARFQLDKTKLDREKELLDEGFISKFAYDELKTNYQASLQKIKEQQAALQRAHKQLSNTVIKAPFAGYIYQRNTDNGQLATPNTKLFSLANLDIMQITASIPGDEINNIKPGQIVSFQVEADKNTYTGKITRVNPVAEVGTRSYLIYIEFDNKTYKLKAGQFVKGQVILNQLRNINYVSSQGIKHEDNKTFVLLLRANGTVEKKYISVLIENKVLGISGISGLQNNDLVINNNVNTLKVGDKASIID